VSILSRILDERFFEHRRRSTSHAGVAAAALAIVLFEFRYYGQGILDWYLLAIGITFVVIKLSLMTFYYLTD
jgi:hypothetical protein